MSASSGSPPESRQAETDRGALFLGEYARAANPFAEVGRRTVSVQVASVVRSSDTSFRINWTEQVYERGSLASTSRWTAVTTIKLQPPRSADVLRRNPLGLYVDAIDWSRELETPTLPAAEQSAARHAPGPQREAARTANIPTGSPLDPRPAVTPPASSPPEGETR